MSALRNLFLPLLQVSQSFGRSANVFMRDMGHGMLEVSHNTLALVGLVMVAVMLFFFSRGELRTTVERETLTWLQERHEARTVGTMEALTSFKEPGAIQRATATDPKELTRQQASVAVWLARRYRVAPEPVSRLVKEAWAVGAKANLDPTLILAIMAIESSFNPFAQSTVGAQGLMQVMTQIHDDKYEAFGGNHAAFDPVTNLRVGVQVLKECISRAGSLEAGLRYYVGAANLTDDGGYAGKVLAEQEHLRLVASGKTVAFNAPLIVAPAAPLVVPASLTVPATTLPKPATPATDKPPAQVASIQ